jgi:pyruvate dehydrogenase E1 component alpha subunit
MAKAAASKKIKSPTKKQKLGFMEQMLLIRRFEEKAALGYGLRKIRGFCHLYIGQEAVAVGAIGALDLKKDYVAAAYRDHGQALACGMDPDGLMAELYGKAGGCSAGLGGSMHFFSAEKHFLGGNGIVGAHIPIATGVGLKIAYNDEDGVALCFFGDGAIHQGSFHESLNLASIWNLPVVYICENNFYGMGTAFERVSAVTDLSSYAASYNMPGRQVDGMDVLSVYHDVSEAVEHARKKRRPALLEVRTYRYKGHSMSDPAKYRSSEEVESYRQRDPILILKDDMTAAGQLTDDEFEKMDKAAADRAEKAVEFAENDPEPELDARFEHVFSD